MSYLPKICLIIDFTNNLSIIYDKKQHTLIQCIGYSKNIFRYIKKKKLFSIFTNNHCTDLMVLSYDFIIAFFLSI